MPRVGLINRETIFPVEDLSSFLTAISMSQVGAYIYVNSSTGSDSSGDGTASSPYATIDAAIGHATPNHNDYIFVMAGHAETITGANAVDLDVAGVRVVGLGVGTNRPTITFGTNTTATVRMNAANTLFKNIRFKSNVDSLAKMLVMNTGDNYVEDCDFIGVSTKEVINAINITTTFDDFFIRRCRFIQPTDVAGTNGGANTGAIYMVDSENVLIEDCEFRGGWETAFIHNKTTGAANLWVRRCYGVLSSVTSDAVPFVLPSGCTGGAEDCTFINVNEAATTEATLSGAFPAGFFNSRTYFGNDGGGGQLAIASQDAAT